MNALAVPPPSIDGKKVRVNFILTPVKSFYNQQITKRLGEARIFASFVKC
jgi:hypothetical protein